MLVDKLRTRIRAEGPIPFEVFMAACLYDPEFGFFTAGPLRSVKSGDFLTSPEVSPWFGRTLARFMVEEQRRTGAEPFLVVDAGAGSGSLLRPLIEVIAGGTGEWGQGTGDRGQGTGDRGQGTGDRGQETGARSDVPPTGGRGDAEERSDEAGGQAHPPPHGEVPTKEAEGVEQVQEPSFEFRAIEASPAAREALAELLDSACVHDSIDDLPDRFSGVIVANELLDNLPVALAIRTSDSWVERWVGATGERLGFVTAPARPEVTRWCNDYAGSVPDGGMVEVQIEATEWVRSAIERLHRGSVVVIDYGGTTEELEPRRTQGTLRTYRSHHLGPDPLLEPGATDVTVDVNFTAMAAAAESTGARVELHRQDDFLADLGLRDVVRGLRHRERDLAREGDDMERLMVRSEATDAETLLHPRGLGDFRVLVARKP